MGWNEPGSSDRLRPSDTQMHTRHNRSDRPSIIADAGDSGRAAHVPGKVEERHRQALAQRQDRDVITIRFAAWRANVVQCTVSRPEKRSPRGANERRSFNRYRRGKLLLAVV
ncbi:hypothetical protein DC522_32360 [Microvirga sp. KLBC 81]|nr:hypothetical protein DC522_32360 [Microvirga sp. KLBC 81]